jgi:hypothetical protein
MDEDELRQRVRAIENEINSGRYRSGEWTHLVDEICRRPRAERDSLRDDVNRVSRALHRRHAARTIPVWTAIGAEVGLAVFGAALISIAGRNGSDTLALLGVCAWIIAFQPLLKFAVGRALGVEYEYAYLLGVEPRLKMKYGSYVAVPRWRRVAFHLFGMVGSPLGALAGWALMPSSLGLARAFSIAGFWALSALNAGLLIAGLVGVRRIFGVGIALSSGGGAARELRAGLQSGRAG